MEEIIGVLGEAVGALLEGAQGVAEAVGEVLADAWEETVTDSGAEVVGMAIESLPDGQAGKEKDPAPGAG